MTLGRQSAADLRNESHVKMAGIESPPDCLTSNRLLQPVTFVLFFLNSASSSPYFTSLSLRLASFIVFIISSI